MTGERVSHSWCMDVVTHGNCGLGGGRKGVDGWYACRTKPGGWSHIGDAGALPECEVIH